MEETSEFVEHTACNHCGSSDGNSRYSDGHSFCFVCQTYTSSNTDVIHTNKLKHAVQLQGSAERLQKRKLSEKVCQKYKIYRDGQILRFYYHTRDGVLKGCKVKTNSKELSYEVETPEP